MNTAPRVFSSLLIAAITWTSLSCTHKQEDPNTLHVPMIMNIKGFDPINSNDLYAAEVMSTVYESLYQYNFLKRPLVVEPLLADGMPTVSKDGLTYTIKLKKGVHFTDSDIFPGGKGREVTMKDVLYSWRRLCDPANQSEGFWVFDGKIKGLNEWRTAVGKGQATYDTPIEGLQVPDDSTLVIKLTKPSYQFLFQITQTYTAVVPHEAVEKYGKEFVNHPTGTGPYMLEEWIRNNRITVVKNPQWHGENYPTEGEASDAANGFLADAGKALPFVNRVVFHEVIEQQPRWLSFMKGDIDYVEIPKDNFDASVVKDEIAPELAAKGLRLRKDPDLDLVFIGFNMLDPILGKNEKVRKAMSMAYDSPAFLSKFWNGRGVYAQGPIPPGLDGYDPNFKNPNLEQNIARAKKFLAEAGYPDGKGLPEFEYSVPNSTADRQGGELFQQDMEKIGIKVRVAMSSWPQFNEKLDQKKVQIFTMAWSGDYPDAENFLQLLYGPNESPGSNHANYHNAEYDQLYQKAALMQPGPERTAIYKKMQDIVVRDMPWIPSINRITYRLYQGWVNNFKMNLVILNPYKYMRIDTDKKKELKAKL